MNTIIRTCIRFFLCTPLTKRMGRVAGTLFLLTAAPLCYADGIDIRVTPNGIVATATVEATATVLRVGGPEGFRDEVQVSGGYVEWRRPGDLPDGKYRYEVYVITGSEDDGGAQTPLYRANGRFEIRDGILVAGVDLQRARPLADERLLPPDSAPTAIAEPAPGAFENCVTYVANALLDFLFSPAHAQLEAESTNPFVAFEDTSSTHEDWLIIGTGTNSDGEFQIQDRLGFGGPGGNAHAVISITGTHGTQFQENSIRISAGGDILFTDDVDLYIDDSTGRVGIGTTVPSRPLHIADSAPTIRLDDVGNRVWEINSNSESIYFDIRDVTSGISPLTIRGASGLVTLTGPFSVGSSRDIKHAFATVEPRDVLNRLLKLEVSQWSYNSEDVAVRHMGPVAEDFGALFALGPDDKHVSPTDMSGVAFAAIQGLHQIVREREADLRKSQGKLKEQVESRDAEIDTLRKSQARLQEQVSSRDAEITKLRQSRDDFAARIEALERLVILGST